MTFLRKYYEMQSLISMDTLQDSIHKHCLYIFKILNFSFFFSFSIFLSFGTSNMFGNYPFSQSGMRLLSSKHGTFLGTVSAHIVYRVHYLSE